MCEGENGGVVYQNDHKEGAPVTVLQCGDFRTTRWEDRRIQQEMAIDPLARSMGIIAAGETLNFDEETCPGPAVPFSSDTYNVCDSEIGVICEHITTYMSLHKGEFVFFATHWDCGREGPVSGRKVLTLLQHLHTAIERITNALPDGTCCAALIYWIKNGRTVKASGFTVAELDARITEIRLRDSHKVEERPQIGA